MFCRRNFTLGMFQQHFSIKVFPSPSATVKKMSQSCQKLKKKNFVGWPRLDALDGNIFDDLHFFISFCQLFLANLRKKLASAVVVFSYFDYLYRFLSRIFRLGEKSRVGEGRELPGGSGGMPPPLGNFLKWMCNEMQSGAFWNTVMSYSVLRQGMLTSCALTSSRLDNSPI